MISALRLRAESGAVLADGTARRPTRRRELALWRAGAAVVAGADEVGRGPLAGPLVVGAVVLPRDRRPAWLPEVRDSKQLAPPQRARLAPLIRAEAAGWGIGEVPAAELDRIGLAAALRLAYRRALEALPQAPDAVLADGRDRLELPWPTEMIVRGDASVASIAAASIVAKEWRDGQMAELDARHPQYGFARHKGYGTPRHLAALRSHGPCPEHRRSFAPVRAAAAGRQLVLAAG